ncbi:MAG: hypothetical protein C5B60_12205 [Chloroflexi bacterium]|nr:MAG: hypothetical protein C5B60_12205 [Chloroflexota bacterium]
MCILRACRPRTVILLSLASLAAVLLTGCMRIQRALVIYGNGSGSYTLTIGFPEPAPGDSSGISSKIEVPMDAFGAHVQQEGGTYRRYTNTSQNYVYWAYTSSFSSLADGNGLLQEDPRQYDPNHLPVLFKDTLKISKVVESSTTLYQVTGTISLADPLGNNTSWKDATESVAITMADGISTHSGGTLTGNTVMYAIAYKQTATISVTGNGSATTTGVDNSTQATQARFIAVGVLLALAVILGGVGGWLLRGALKRS